MDDDTMADAASLRCLRDLNPVIPTVITTTVTNIHQSASTSGGNVTYNGGATVTARGVCWGTSSNPTTAGSHTSEGSGTGVFVSHLTGLIQNTLYYLRAFATNSVGTAYGAEVSFFTAEGCPGIPILTYGGKTYNTVQIGSQCWMAQNLNIGNMIPGASEQTNLGPIEKYFYNDDEVNCSVYGGIYQWDNMMQWHTVYGKQGICPSGWHIPTDAEWTTLTDFLGGEGVSGGKLKESYTTHWANPNTGATNSTGFTGLPGGYRYCYESCSTYDLSTIGACWTSSGYSENEAWFRHLYYNSETTGRYFTEKINGYSVRHLKDEPVVYPFLQFPGSYQGWHPADSSATIASTDSVGKYKGYIWFWADSTKFKYTQGPSWITNWGDDNADGTLDPVGANIKAGLSGYYKLNVNLDSLSHSFLRTTWAVIGDASPGWWWSDTDMSYDPATGIWSVTLYLSKDFIKFRANHNWTLNYGDNGADGTLEELGANIAVPATGNYTVTLNLGKPIYEYKLTPSGF